MIGCSILKTRWNKDFIDHARALCTKSILNCHDQSDWVQFLMNPKEDNDVIDPTGVVWLQSWDLFDQVQSMTKTIQGNDVTNYTSAFYIENDSELS